MSWSFNWEGTGVDHTLDSIAGKTEACPMQIASAVGIGVFLCPRHPATGYGDLLAQ